MEVRDCPVLVTGGASGIGRQLVGRLSAEGAKLAVLDSDAAMLDRLGIDVPEAARFLCDVGDSSAAEAGVREAADRIGGIAILINNAAIARDALLVSVSPAGISTHGVADWDAVIRTNLSGPFYVARAAAGIMVKSRTRGLIVNMSSVTASGNQGQSAYAASKAGIESLTVTWARELANFGIRVAAVAPGFVDSGITARQMNESLKKMWVGRTPQRRLATAEEVVDGVMFVIRNDFFCGRVLRIDGGVAV